MVRAERKRLELPEDGDIFVIDGRYQSFYSALGKMINNYCDELRIPRRSLHSTRRTCASMMHASTSYPTRSFPEFNRSIFFARHGTTLTTKSSVERICDCSA